MSSALDLLGDPDPHTDDLDDLFDYYSMSYVYSGFRRLNGRIYSVSSVRKILSLGCPEIDGRDGAVGYFLYFSEHDIDPVRKTDFSEYRTNPMWRLREDEPSHLPIQDVEASIGAQLDPTDLARLRRRVMYQRIEFDHSGLLDIDIKCLHPHETDDIILRVVDEMAVIRRVSSNPLVVMLQQQMDEIVRDSRRSINTVRRMHYKIKAMERKAKANGRCQRERHRLLLSEIRGSMNRRLNHDDKHISALQKRINRTHKSNYDLIHRVHRRILRREEKLKYNEDLYYDDTASEGEELPYPHNHLSVLRDMYDEGT